jgi:hypothetical protein
LRRESIGVSASGIEPRLPLLYVVQPGADAIKLPLQSIYALMNGGLKAGEPIMKWATITTFIRERRRTR